MADHPNKIYMQNQYEMPVYLVKLVQKYELMSSHEREEDEGKKLREMIHVVGSTAAFFGRYDGMKELHDAAEKIVGNDNSIGYRLNLMWDRIGGWWA